MFGEHLDVVDEGERRGADVAHGLGEGERDANRAMRQELLTPFCMVRHLPLLAVAVDEDRVTPIGAAAVKGNAAIGIGEILVGGHERDGSAGLLGG
jgi:hypothetical protein